MKAALQRNVSLNWIENAVCEWVFCCYFPSVWLFLYRQLAKYLTAEKKTNI